MSFAVDEFWKLAVESQALSHADYQRLAAEFARIKGAAQTANARTLADWLVDRRALSRYQAKVLLARRAGPFVYSDYKLIDRYEAGRLAGLFRAVHQPTGLTVSLQFLAGPAVADPQAMALLATKCLAAAQVRHPQVARVYHLVDLGTYKFIALADLEGSSLEEHVASSRRMPHPEACRLVRLAAMGLAQLHQAGQIHGEVRPANLWLTPKQQLLVLHLPLVRDPFGPPSVPHAAGVTQQQLEAAADYLAPELNTPGHWPNERSDVYALGCTLYELLAGRPPFAQGDVASKLRRHASEQPPSIKKLNVHVPGPVAQVVEYMLAKDPAGRYQQMAHVAEALLPYIDPRAAQIPPEQPSAASRAYDEWLRRLPAAARTASASPPLPAAATVHPAAGIARAQPVMATAPASVPAAFPAAAPAIAAVPAVVPNYPQSAVAAPSEAAFAVGVSGPTKSVVAERIAQQRKARRSMLLAAGVVMILLGVVAIVAALNWPQGEAVAIGNGQQQLGGETRPGKIPGASNGDGTPKSPAVGEPATGDTTEEPIASLDSEPMWQSPTAGPPLDLSYFPAGVRAYLAIRPAEIWAHEEARRVLAAVGIDELVGERLTSLAGTPPENIEQATFGFGGAAAENSFVARTRESVAEEDLLKHWGASEATTVAGQRVFKAGGVTYFAPSEHRNKLIVAVDTTDDKQLETFLSMARSTSTLRELEVLRRVSDSSRHCTFLFSPTYLGSSGGRLFVGSLARLKEPLLGFLVNELGTLPQGCLASVHVDDDMFSELRLAPGTEPQEGAKLYRKRVAGLTEQMYDYVGGSISPYSARILQRFPRWLEELDRYTRAGTSDKQVVVRSYLPAVAAHNLAFGTHLALLESPGSAMSVAVQGGSAAAKPKSLAEMLKQPYTLSFDRDSLERTLDLISKDTGIPIVILGGDLQLEGITKNQSFTLDEKQKPIAGILQTIMKKANPEGKLIYVFAKEGDKEVLQVTTRAAAAKRGDKIPPEFAQ